MRGECLHARACLDTARCIDGMQGLSITIKQLPSVRNGSSNFQTPVAHRGEAFLLKLSYLYGVFIIKERFQIDTRVEQ